MDSQEIDLKGITHELKVIVGLLMQEMQEYACMLKKRLQGWVDVKEALPQAYVFVLVYCHKQGIDEPRPMTIARWTLDAWEPLCDTKDNNSCACTDLFWEMSPEEITHWMLLPKGPEM